jgi:hypothetical protein
MRDIKPNTKKLSPEDVAEIKKEIGSLAEEPENYKPEINPTPEVDLPLEPEKPKSVFESEAEKIDLKAKLEKIYAWRDDTKIKEEANPEENKKNHLGMVMSIIGLVVVVAVIAGAFYFFKIKTQPTEAPVATETEFVVENPQDTEPAEEVVQEVQSENIPVPEKNLKPAEIKISILNGGAAAGTAGKVKTLLVGQGYKLAEAKNAEGDAYVGTIIYYIEGLSKNAETVKEVLKVKYPKAETKAAATTEEKSADIVIILGK